MNYFLETYHLNNILTFSYTTSVPDKCTLEIILVLTEFNYKSKCKKDSESTFLKKGGFIMKTFLGFTTGLFSGTLIGMGFMSILLIAYEELRDCADTVANGIYDT